MSTADEVADAPITTEQQRISPDSYTAVRLSHATPEHLYLTTRRCFIGPVPEGWLRSHRKTWIKHHLHVNYSSRAATFHAAQNVGRHKRITGLQDINNDTRLSASFPQPDDLRSPDVEEEIEDEHSVEEAGSDEEATLETPPALAVPRARNPDRDVPQITRSDHDSEGHTTGEGHDAITTELTGKDRDQRGSDEAEATQRPLLQSTITTESFKTAYEHNGNRSSTEVNRAEAASRAAHTQGLATDQQSEALAPPHPRGTSFGSYPGPGSTSTSEGLERSNSRSALITERDDPNGVANVEDPSESKTRALLGKVRRKSSKAGENTEPHGDGEPAEASRQSRVLFDLPEDSARRQILERVRTTPSDLQDSARKILKRRTTEGQVIKMEKMLVRVDSTPENVLPDDYDENCSQTIISKVVERWREYMVVVRRTTQEADAPFVLQMYKSRVIPAVDASRRKKRAAYEVFLGKKSANVNLYSSLDKTVVLWTAAAKIGTSIYILRPKSNANAAEWYTFLRKILGWQRSPNIEIAVPDLSVTLRLVDPFREHARKAKERRNEATSQNGAHAGHVAIDMIDRCMDMLKTSPEYGEVIQAWLQNQRLGFAWKRYDRLEWVHGQGERDMYGTMAMTRSHDLELRPKQHYPTSAHTRKGKPLEEPPPVEGFLIRLTSQKGHHQRMGKLFYKRLYFSTHDHYLVFSRPARVEPPPPPTLPATADGKIPSAHQIAESIPLIYAVNPFPVEQGEISWLKKPSKDRPAEMIHKDQDAYDEMLRNNNILQDCDGYIDLCNVKKVREVRLGTAEEDEGLDSGSEVDFSGILPPHATDDGTTTQVDREKTFELKLSNGLVVRLQAYDEQTRNEWMKRLHKLVRYWKARHSLDTELFKQVRQRNLEALHIDEEAEAILGQFARKWEVTQAYASPELYNICGISCCRSIHISGPLYRKPRRHSLFTGVNCILISGQMLIFSNQLRTHSGQSVPHIHQEKIDTINLAGCYLYSGLLTENDLLYQNQTFDSNNPGHHALPRVWLDEAWTSRDEDVMTCFVIWQPTSKSWFRRGAGVPGAEEGHRARIKRVSQLGVQGRTIVFKARTRVERDHWVLALATQIERLQKSDDVRLTKSEED